MFEFVLSNSERQAKVSDDGRGSARTSHAALGVVFRVSPSVCLVYERERERSMKDETQVPTLNERSERWRRGTQAAPDDDQKGQTT